MKRAILKITAVTIFALMMILNVTMALNNTNFSLGGLKALAQGTSDGGGSGSCYYSRCDSYSKKCVSNQNMTNCAGPGGKEPCSSTWNCN